MAHSFVQAFEDETEAFGAFAAHYPGDPTLLVDTYDTLEGVRRAIEVANELRRHGRRVRGIRLDSGDLAGLAREARRLLDEPGHRDTLIFASGGLDGERIHDLLEEGAPIDAFGVGSSLTVSSDHPALDIVYKLVAYEGKPRAKQSEAKATFSGAKRVFRKRGGPAADFLGLPRPLYGGAGAGVPRDRRCLGGASDRGLDEGRLARVASHWGRYRPGGRAARAGQSGNRLLVAATQVRPRQRQRPSALLRPSGPGSSGA